MNHTVVTSQVIAFFKNEQHIFVLSHKALFNFIIVRG